MYCLLAALLSAASPAYVIFSRGRPVDPAAQAISEPSGMRSLTRQKSRLARAEVLHTPRFQAWLEGRGWTAVPETAGTQAMPVLIARGPRRVLARYGRIEATRNPGVFTVELGAGIVDAEERARALAREPEVEWAEPDRWGRFETRAFNDPFYLNQWHLHPTMMSDVAPNVDIGAERAWELTRGAGSIIAVLDDGFSLSHPDLSDQYLRDADGVVGKDYFQDDADPSGASADGHGTRVLGVAAARGNNGIGVSGVCPECKAIPIRLFTSGEAFDAWKTHLYGPMSVAADAMIWAADRGARVINNSWGPLVPRTNPQHQAMPQVVYDAITNVVRRGPAGQEGKAGVLITWAAGNNDHQVASFDGWVSDGRVLAVGAMNSTGKLANYSEIGPPIRLLAPSSERGSALPAIYTTDRQDAYSSVFGGTSAAAPIVAGAAALLLARHPELSLAQVFEVLLDSARKASPSEAQYGRDGKSCTHGYGEVNAADAIALAEQRATDYAAGHTLHFELCGDGIDNDANPSTTDTCAACVPTSQYDTPNGLDDDCDGFVDNAAACEPRGFKRCEVCARDGDCAQDFACLNRGADGMRCMRTCDLYIRCGYDETCVAGACMPTRRGVSLECSAFLQCAPSNGGVETCDDIDNDCNGQVDDIAANAQEALTQTSALRRAKFGVCGAIVAECKGGRWVASDPGNRVEEEVDLCDDLDNDCDGQVDEGCPPKAEASSQPTSCRTSGGDALGWLCLYCLIRRSRSVLR